MATIPIGLAFVLTRISILKDNLREALELNQKLSARIQAISYEDSTIITLTGTTKEHINVLPENILYIESADNYMDVYYLDEDHVAHKLLRSTIKQMEEQLKDYPAFIRCHRAFVVNTDRISNIEGNAQGYKLKLRHTPKEIPVSRTYMRNLKEAIG